MSKITQLDMVEQTILNNMQLEERCLQLIQTARENYSTWQLEQIIRLLSDLIHASELSTLKMRGISTNFGLPVDNGFVNSIIRDAFEFFAGFSDRGWFVMEIPPLTKKKDHKASRYMKEAVMMLLTDFFRSIPSESKPDYGSAVLIYNNISSSARSFLQLRDNDNLEYNDVTNAVSCFLLPDDNPVYCSHYRFTTVGDRDRTQVILLPFSDFSDFLDLQKRQALNFRLNPLPPKNTVNKTKEVN